MKLAKLAGVIVLFVSLNVFASTAVVIFANANGYAQFVAANPSVKIVQVTPIADSTGMTIRLVVTYEK